ncbi:DNA polymerase III subunit alpha [Streptomyces sp. SL13]|uniref:DNA polymerase III subunit alpha n=1 Tax=Streptantibioticus silvisoli TaxID=2705255 RepID=A0AA90JXK6_9ACTN|nr:DNA polymerase III subunit alpha [Streptantibioticus silvisoli]MDI5970271.1 DNA polymerase III subunit alpha [Streptantibioticus silvisoli]
MTTPPFAHLHVHTPYSLLDGACRTADLLRVCRETGMTHLGMTDHGNLAGAPGFHRQALEAGVTPVIGMEAYVAPGPRADRTRVHWGTPGRRRDDVSGGGAYTHVTLWATDATGLRHLTRLSGDAYRTGRLAGRPRTDRESLAALSGGLAASTGCPSGEVQTRLRLGQFDAALAAAATYRDIFGADRYFLELMDHGLEIERRVREDLLEIGRRLRIPPLVTNDAHYTYPRQAAAHDVLLCVRTGSTLADPDRFAFRGTGYHLRTPREMYALDSSDAWQRGCANTVLLAERVDPAGWFAPRDLRPHPALPAGRDEAGELRAAVARGLARRYPGGVPRDRRARAAHETGVIISTGFAGYFLVVAEIVAWARSRGIAVGPGRGSAPASLVAHLLGITGFDPVDHGLVFERFLNPERGTAPDIDIDLDERRRPEAVAHVTARYGADHVALVGTHPTVKARNAVRDAARVLGRPYALGDRAAKALPAAPAGVPLAAVLEPDHPRHRETAVLRAMYDADPRVREILETASGIEGLVRHNGVHPAGVVVAGEPLADHVALWTRPGEQTPVTQWDHTACEALGLLKIDLLGLRNLTVLSDAARLVEAAGRTAPDPFALPPDDAATWSLLGRGETLGVFQFDGGPVRALLRMIRPDRLADLCAATALYRPGPMGADAHLAYARRKHGEEPVAAIHPEVDRALRPVLADTYGLIVYQEQVQRVAQVVAGHPLGRADLLRRALSGGPATALDAEYGPFRDGARRNGYGDEAIRAVWRTLVAFAGYAFNKAHAVAYGLIGYATAYYKAHHPAAFMAALLTSVRDDRARAALYLSEARRMGLTVLPPDINASGAGFTAPDATTLRLGLSAVRNVGRDAVDSVLATRERHGRYASFPDFLTACGTAVRHRRVVDSLIRAGAFDSLGYTRKGLADRAGPLLAGVVAAEQREAAGQFGLFALPAAPPGGPPGTPAFDDREWEPAHRLAQEREMLGLHVGDHPLRRVADRLAEHTDTTLAALTADDLPDGTALTAGGLLTGIRPRTTRRGDPYAEATLEDLTGSVTCVVLPAAYRQAGAALAEDAVVLVTGRLEHRDGTPRLVAGEVTVPDLAGPAAPAGPPVTVDVPAARLTAPLVRRLGRVLAGHRGGTEVRVRVRDDHGTTVLRLDRDHRVTADPALYADLDALLG